MHRKALIPAAVAAVGITGTSLTASACGGSVTVNSPAPQPSTPAVTNPPSTTGPTPAPSTTPPSAPSAVPAPAPVTTQPQITNPWAVVSAYYGDIESGNYAQAWSLLSPSMQAQLGPYNAWVAGYQTTQNTTLSELGLSGGTVTVSISATETDGTRRSYTGYYTVDNGKITSARITQN